MENEKKLTDLKPLSRNEMKNVMGGNEPAQCTATTDCHVGCKDYLGNCSACCIA